MHSTLAYIGEVSGIDFVADAIVKPDITKFISTMQTQEMAKSIVENGEIDLISYASTIRKRISNPTLRHRAHQIAMDGSQKMQQRIFDPMNDLAKLGFGAPIMCAAVAIWIHFLATNSQIDDPLAYKLTPLAQNSDPIAAVSLTLRLPDFAQKLDASFYGTIAKDLAEIRSSSVRQLISNRIGGL